MLNLNGDLCPYCNGTSLLRYSAPAHDAAPLMVNIIKCEACDAAWQWPLQRTAQQSVIEFQDAYSSQHESSYFDPIKREAVAHCQCEFLASKFAKPSRLLDIGCGDGNFARAMAKRGWNVVGLDPAILAPVTEEATGGRLTLQPGSIANLREHEVFDLITLWDVIEHVEKPGQLITEAATRLTPGGVLVVETGNYQSAGRVQSRGAWWNYQIDHRWYLAPPQLRSLLNKAGLRNIEIANRVLRPWWKGQSDMPPPRLSTLAKAIVKRPRHLGEALRTHHELVHGFNKWTSWGGLEIMTMMGHKAEAQ